MPETHPRVIVVGGGLAGLAATVRIAEAGTPVDLSRATASGSTWTRR